MRGMPQAENGGKLGQGTREFTGTSVMIVFVPVYALVAMALAQTRPPQHAPGLVLALCFAGLGLAWTLPIMPQIRWMEKTRSENVTPRLSVKPRPGSSLAATRPAGQ
ncbi:MAG: DUF2842 domain-containing protein [Methylocella sp.]